VGQEAMGVASRMVAIPSKVLDKSIVGNEPSLRQAVHALADFNKDGAIVNKGGKLVLLPDTGRNGPDKEVHVLVALHGRVQVVVGNVKAGVGGIRRQEHAVDNQLGGDDIGSGSTDIAGIFY
jgi:hypothetical protein